MNIDIFLMSIFILIIAYPFSIYFKLKSLNKKLTYHWEKIESLVKQYKTNPLEETKQSLNHERRAYNSFVRANDHKLDSIIGKFMANKYGFEKKEHFDFKG